MNNFVNKLVNLEEMDKFLEKCNLLKLIQGKQNLLKKWTLKLSPF